MKKYFFILLLYLLIFPALAQETLNEKEEKTSLEKQKKWSIGLPLRFTQIQNAQTMLSGINIGRDLNNRWTLFLSVYHSFYFDSFKPIVNIEGTDLKPHLFINCVGIEPSLKMYEYKNFSAKFQFLIGWGFMKYDLKENSFKSKQVNYVALEPSLILEYKFASSTSLSFGVGFRPLLTNKDITFVSDTINGEIPIAKKIPNGLNLLLTLKGYL